MILLPEILQPADVNVSYRQRSVAEIASDVEDFGCRQGQNQTAGTRISVLVPYRDYVTPSVAIGIYSSV
jgi:hypothetical protein